MNTKVKTALIAIAGAAIVSATSLAQDDKSPRNAGDPPPQPRGEAQRGPGGRQGGQRYSIEQAASDKAQLHTIAFNGLAFLTGDFGADTFLPPGKVCDFFGFQYMRDIDAAEKGHNPMFLNRVAGNVLQVLSAPEREQLAALAREQAPQFQELARMRWPLIKAFRRELEGKIPAGSKGLNREAVAAYVGDIFAFDAQLSYRRAEVLGKIASSLSPEQKAYLAEMKFGDFRSWPEADAESYKMPRGTEKMINVAYMTYASEFFSWYAGSEEADTYFCPERHGTYFGGFYMKDMPAMGKRDYDISTSRTGDAGRDFLELLTPEQRKAITEIPGAQRASLARIVQVRREISSELRKALAGGKADRDKVVALGREYGQLDGDLSWMYAKAFASVNASLNADQREAMRKLRNLEGYKSAAAYIYSDPLSGDLKLPDTDPFFFAPKGAKQSDNSEAP